MGAGNRFRALVICIGVVWLGVAGSFLIGQRDKDGNKDSHHHHNPHAVLGGGLGGGGDDTNGGGNGNAGGDTPPRKEADGGGNNVAVGQIPPQATLPPEPRGGGQAGNDGGAAGGNPRVGGGGDGDVLKDWDPVRDGIIPGNNDRREVRPDLSLPDSKVKIIHGYRLEECPWSSPAGGYPEPYWKDQTGLNMIKFVRTLNEAGILYLLIKGSDIGAIRHGGPIPCDGDMDIAFPVWLNGDLATCDDAKVPTLRGYESSLSEAMLTLCDKTRAEYVEIFKAWIAKKLPQMGIAPRSFGGFSGTMHGVRTDMVVSILDQSYLHEGPLCWCRFGDTWALSVADNLVTLKHWYGDDVMTPDANKRGCIGNQAPNPPYAPV